MLHDPTDPISKRYKMGKESTPCSPATVVVDAPSQSVHRSSSAAQTLLNLTGEMEADKVSCAFHHMVSLLSLALSFSLSLCLTLIHI